MTRSELAREWASALDQVVYVARGRAEIEADLATLIGGFVDLLLDARADLTPAIDAGVAMVHAGFTKPGCVQCSVEVLGRGLPRLPELAGRSDLGVRTISVLGAFAGGLAEGIREHLFSDQEDIREALVRAKENAERSLLLSEARFREVFRSSVLGIAITDLSGVVVDVNAALAEILGGTIEKLRGRDLYQLYHPDEVDGLRTLYQDLAEQRRAKVRLRAQLLRVDGDPAWVSLVMSTLPGDDGRPLYHVTLVENVSDLLLLETELARQGSHDVLTGLPNRQAFVNRLHEKLVSPDPDVTVFHIDLDGFSVINDGLGKRVGDLLLAAVGERLRATFAKETAVVARLAADEFAVMVENTPTTPDVAKLAAKINDELTEPTYVDGDLGVAATATIAVVRRPARGTDPDDLLRSTDITLRRLKAAGRRQWAEVDPEQEARDRARFRLAASVPGAWETGEIDLVYQPMVSLEHGGLVAVQAQLRWNHPSEGMLGHTACVELMEETGQSLPIGRWMLHKACERMGMLVDRTPAELPLLYVELTKEQSSDPDLVAAVQEGLNDTRLVGSQLRIGMPVHALCMEDGLAEENLGVLTDLGVTSVLYGFGRTRGDIACMEDLPVSSVKLADLVVNRIFAPGGQSSMFARALRELVPLVRGSGLSVIAGLIQTTDQANWWHEAGITVGMGALYGEPGPFEDVEALIKSHV